MIKFGSMIVGPVAPTTDGIRLYASEFCSLSGGRAAAKLGYIETQNPRR